LFSIHETIAQVLDPIVNGFDLLFEYLALDELTDAKIAQIMKETGRSARDIRRTHRAATLKTSKMGKTISKTANFIAVVAFVADVGSEHIENSENNENVVVDCAVDVLEIVTIHAVGYAVAYAFSLLGPLGMIVGGLLSYGLTTALKAACE